MFTVLIGYLLFNKNTKLAYQNGKLITDVSIVTVWWGPNVKYTSEIEQFYSTITSSRSSWFSLLFEYSISNYTINYGSYVGSFNYTNGASGLISPILISDTISNLVQNGSVPKGNYYSIHFSGDTTIQDPSGTSCVDYYAYHSLNQDIIYGVVPECKNKYLNLFDSITKAASHELAESITDPFINGWLIPPDTEIADLCNHKLFSSNGYVLNSLYSNRLNRCIADPSISVYVLTAVYSFLFTIVIYIVVSF